MQHLPLDLLLKSSSLEIQSFNPFLLNGLDVCIKRRYESISENSLTPRKHEHDLCEVVDSGKIVLISDSAKTGKSTSAEQIAKDLKLKNPLSWVVFIDLELRFKVFSQDGPIDSNYFSCLLGLKKLFEQKLFENLYENKRVIFIFDGYGELSPENKSSVIRILKTVKNSQNKLLVTTRPHCAEELQNELNIQRETFRLMPLIEKDLVDILTELMQHMFSGSDIKSKIAKLLEKFWNSSLSIDFFTVPLHIQMLAELFDDQNLDISDETQLNIDSLFRRMIEKRLESCGAGYRSKKRRISTTDISTSSNLAEMFHKLALENVCNAHEIAELDLSTKRFDGRMMASAGIVSFDTEDSVQFLHKTFAEYFAADYIFNTALGGSPTRSAVKLFVCIIQKDGLGPVRKFINDRLQNDGDERLNGDVLAKYIGSSMYRNDIKEIYDLLGHIVEENQTNMITFILESLNFDYTLKVKFVRDVLHRAAASIKSLTTIWKSVEKFVEQHNIKDVQRGLLLHKNKDDEYILETATLVDCEEGVNVKQCILNIAKKSLNEDEFRKFYSGQNIRDYPERSFSNLGSSSQ